MAIRFGVQDFIRARRRSLPLSLAAKAAERYLKIWYNDAFFNFDLNGEVFAMKSFARWAGDRPILVWDVGAHRGEWADEAVARLPHAHVHSFEVVPSIAKDIAPHPRRTAHVLGLSDKAGEFTINHNTTFEKVSSFEDWSRDDLFVRGNIERITCNVTTGDRFAAEHGAPDLMKIDVEGHEISVLRGCSELLGGCNAPTMIQIEYGNTFLYSHSTLRDLYDLLPGYSIGRLYPNHVEFRDYHFRDDHFRMGNMIAVKDDRLRALLS